MWIYEYLQESVRNRRTSLSIKLLRTVEMEKTRLWFVRILCVLCTEFAWMSAPNTKYQHSLPFRLITVSILDAYIRGTLF